jgi:putative addiction module CopG family antidote
MAMTSLNISLPEILKAYVEGQVASGDWGTPSEYIRELIRQDKERRMANLEQSCSLLQRDRRLKCRSVRSAGRGWLLRCANGFGAREKTPGCIERRRGSPIFWSNPIGTKLKADRNLAKRWEEAVTGTLLRIVRNPGAGAHCRFTAAELVVLAVCQSQGLPNT